MLSIIITVYNIESYIEECLKSVSAQSYKEIEIIIINDGSTDGSGEICDSFALLDKRIRVIHQENHGLVYAREIGIIEAQGEYLTFVDGDDWIEKNMYAEMLAEVQGEDLIASGILVNVKDGKSYEVNNIFGEEIYTHDDLKNLKRRFIFDYKNRAQAPMNSSVCNKIFRTEILKKILPYADYDLQYGEDFVLVSKYVYHCNSIRIMNKAFYHYRYRLNSMINSKNDDYLFDLNKIWKATNTYFKELENGEVYLEQIKQKIICLTMETSRLMFGEDTYAFPEFAFQIEKYAGRRVVLFGAGRCGCNYYRGLSDSAVDVVAWLDSTPRIVMKTKVNDIQEISKYDFDIVLIAVGNANMASEMREKLIQQGVSEDKIKWEQPIQVRNFW